MEDKRDNEILQEISKQIKRGLKKIVTNNNLNNDAVILATQPSLTSNNNENNDYKIVV